MELGGLQLRIQHDLRDPVTALGECSDWVTSCLKPGERSLDDCFFSAPPCTTKEPWNEPAACCPAECYAQYAQKRRAGAPDEKAFDEVLFEDGSCVPGLRKWVGKEQP